MNRTHLQRLARIRRRESKILLDTGQYSGSYYLSGYCIECALKACIAKTYQRHAFPGKRKVLDSHTHDLEKLLDTAQLKKQFDTDAEKSDQLHANWAVVKDWKESSRYETKSQKDAQDIYQAVNQRTNGILSWIRHYW